MSSTTTSAPRTARERVRAELTREIKEVARRHLAEQGASGLSLRAVARELGMVSSAVYRYYPSRDDLLTALIIDAYDALGEAVEQADAACRRADTDGRWMAVCHATRAWALEHPQEYALIFGTPVPGYAAPELTIGPATRVPLVLVGILVDALENGTLDVDDGLPVPRRVHGDLARMREALDADVPDGPLVRGVMAWTYLIGAITFEVFGQRNNVVTDGDAFFEHEMRRMGIFVGLRAAAGGRRR